MASEATAEIRAAHSAYQAASQRCAALIERIAQIAARRH